MREISRHTEGLSKPPTLSIYLSFSSSSFQPLVFRLFAAFSSLLDATMYSIFPPSSFPLPVLSFPLPTLPPFFFFSPPSSMRFLRFYALTHTITRVVESLREPKGNHCPRRLGTWQQAKLLNLADFMLAQHSWHHLAITSCSHPFCIALFSL